MTNEILTLIKTRRSIRSFKPDAVPQELLDAVLEAGTYAPTGGGRQSPTIVAVTSETYRRQIEKLNAAVMGKDTDPYYGAPVIVLVLADGAANTFVEDGSCVLENMMLAAASLGFVWCFPGGSGTLAELHQLLHGQADTSFGSGRLAIWRALLPLAAERPLLGGGCGTLYLRDLESFYWYRGGETIHVAITSAHNEYLGILVDQGVLALLAFLALLALALHRAFRYAESDRYAVAGTALICYAVMAFFSVATCITGVFLWLLLALLLPQEA